MLTSFYTVNVNVADLDRSIEFYGKLGFVQVLRFSITDRSVMTMYSMPDLKELEFAWMKLGTATRSGPLLDLVQFVDPPVGPFEGNPTNRPGLSRLTFRVDDMDAQYEHLKELGVDFILPLTRRPGPNGAPLGVMWIKDPDGTVIEMLEVGPAPRKDAQEA